MGQAIGDAVEGCAVHVPLDTFRGPLEGIVVEVCGGIERQAVQILVARRVIVVVRVEVELHPGRDGFGFGLTLAGVPLDGILVAVEVSAEKFDVDLVVLAIATVVIRPGVGEERGDGARLSNRVEACLVAAVAVEPDGLLAPRGIGFPQVGLVVQSDHHLPVGKRYAVR